MGWSKVVVDGTDHLEFFCPKESCEKSRLTIVALETEKIGKDLCSYIVGKCGKCGERHLRKFYWGLSDE